MITLTRLSGSAFVLNSDLIERIDSTPDTVVTLVDGKKYVVTETLAEIIDAVRTYRAHVIAVSSLIADPVPGLHHDDDLRPSAAQVAADRPLATVAQLPSTGHGEA
ncbi:flagellar FlbD family protein [Marmoricola sp. RAF53]|uniref:flagellar FlbD family protein n=1 Tax=Marmoricola sp. RAF53 TaxID=3233059 RepID=UPI003F993C24